MALKPIANLADRASIRLSGKTEEQDNFAWYLRSQKVWGVKLKQKLVKTRKEGEFIEVSLSFKTRPNRSRLSR